MNKKSKREQRCQSIASGTQISRAAGRDAIDNPPAKDVDRRAPHIQQTPAFAQFSASFECNRNKRPDIVCPPTLCLNRTMTNEELSQQITALTTTVTEKFTEIDKRFEQIDTRFEKIDGRLDKLQAGQDDLRTKYGEMNEKQGYIVNAQQTIAKTQDELQRALEEHGAKLEEDFTDMKATQASIQHDISRINRKMIIEAGVRDTMHESVFSTQDSHYRELDRRLRLVEAHFPELGQQGV